MSHKYETVVIRSHQRDLRQLEEYEDDEKFVKKKKEE